MENIEFKSIETIEPSGKIKKQKIKNKRNKLSEIMVTIVLLIWITIVICFLYVIFRPKFKSITVELGSISEVSADSFLVSDIYRKYAEMITNINELDLSKVGEIDVFVLHRGKQEVVKLKIVDTTAPTVKFQDVTKDVGYEINAEDFVVEKTDLSEISVTADEIENMTGYGDYVVKIRVKDIYGNEVSKDCTLTLTWLKALVYKELGSTFTKQDIVVNMEKDADKLPDTEMAKVNIGIVGEYIISVEYEGKKYESKIIVQDTTPPALELKNVTAYLDEGLIEKDGFIKSASDASGTVTTVLKTAINYTKVGTQEIVIEATDVNGNKTEKTAVLTIKKDTVGPVFSKLAELNVAKHSTIDYHKNVKATDAKDGVCEISVDSSAVNTGAAGTYYATYTSKDSKGNTTTAKRKVVVNHDQEDTNNKFNEFYNNNLAGKDVVGMASTIKSLIKYNNNWGGSDPVWYGLTTNSGNCYVHALLLQKALNKAGITNRLINATDNSHYWNLVSTGSGWRHYDSTPGGHIVGPATDEQKATSARMSGKDWNRDAFPKAE